MVENLPVVPMTVVPFEWTPFVVFGFTYLIAALTGLGVELITAAEKKQHLTPGLIIGTLLVYGGVGSSLGMYVGYEYLGGKNAPWKVIACGTLVGGRIIKFKTATIVMQKLLGGFINLSPDDKNDTKKKD